MLAIMFGVFTTLLCNIGLGQLLLAPHTSFAPQFAQNLYIAHALGFMAPSFGRISFCLYMMRILGVTSPSTRFALRTAIVLQLFANLIMTVLVFTQCGSFQALWKHGLQPDVSACIHHDVLRVVALSAVAFNALTDLFLTILPSVIVWKIQAMTARRKVGIAIILGLSFFATVAGICKIYYVNAFYTTQHILPALKGLLIVMGTEINIVIIAASLPTLSPLFLRRFGRDPVTQAQVLPIYEVHVNSGSKRVLPRIGFLSRPGLSSTGDSDVKPDPAFCATLPGTRTDSCHGRSLKVMKMVDVIIASTDMTENITLDSEIVPEDLQEHNLTEEGSQSTSVDCWDELPTPPFLTETRQPEYNLE